MTPFRQEPSKVWLCRVYDSEGRGHRRSTETRNKAEARAVERACEAVRQIPRYRPILDDAVARRTSLPEVRAHYEAGTLDLLLARRDDVDVSPLVADFRAALAGKVADDTAAHYESAVRSLVPEGAPFLRSRLTEAALQDWVDAMDAAPGTVRKRGMGMRRFCAWLVKPRGVLAANPMERVELPAQGKPREHHLETDEARALADAQPEPYRTLSALMAGTGIELSVALRLTRRDVDAPHHEVRAAGTKTHTRDRVVRVAEWAWPYLERHLAGLLPDAPLFYEIPDRWRAREVHNEAREALVARGMARLAGYTPRDARHTYAVRAIRAGVPEQVVADQLGHANTQMVRLVYGRFKPRQDERAKWERLAAAVDDARSTEEGR